MLVRTWNLFHGNTVPPGWQAYLRRMVELIADGADVVALQEVPVWSLRQLERWSGGMQAFGAVAAYPRLRSAEVGRWITELNHGRIRSAVSGQANAILVARDRAAADEGRQVVSRSGERRVCQVVRLDEDIAVANFHVTGGPPADEQFGAVVDAIAAEPRAILAGDANLRPGEGRTYERLRDLGYSAPLDRSIDQIMVRGLPASPPEAWAEDRRRAGNRLLSDHAPVELRIG